ncbi:hypothetical protein EJP617_C160 (plasmid) [Erwinia sp. Ejp617]|nr:hypothetical protein EJP617_C160 [Erwinia sp. Ejp617]
MPLQRCASVSEACSWPSRRLRAACVSCTASRVARWSIFSRSGRVLITRPRMRSASGPACRRPSSTVPNTTLLLPLVCASTWPQARWHRLARLTPSWRACSRRPRLRASGSVRCASLTPCPSACTSLNPKGSVGVSISPSISRKNASCSCWLTPRRAWAIRLR